MYVSMHLFLRSSESLWFSAGRSHVFNRRVSVPQTWSDDLRLSCPHPDLHLKMWQIQQPYGCPYPPVVRSCGPVEDEVPGERVSTKPTHCSLMMLCACFWILIVDLMQGFSSLYSDLKRSDVARLSGAVQISLVLKAKLWIYLTENF